MVYSYPPLVRGEIISVVQLEYESGKRMTLTRDALGFKVKWDNGQTLSHYRDDLLTEEEFTRSGFARDDLKDWKLAQQRQRDENLRRRMERLAECFGTKF